MKKKFTIYFLLLIIISASLFTQNLFAQVTFTAKTDIAITASAGAMFMISADINSDGKPDLITANQSSPGTISILLNTTTINSTTPTFSAQTDFTCGLATHSVSAGDINGDGLIDLVAVNTTAATASVFLNTTTPGATTPTMSIKTDFATGTNPYSVVLKDMNGDGKLDMVCANQTGNSIGVFINTTVPGASTPTFGAMTAFATPAGPTHLAIADLNGDGLPDVVVPNSTTGNISVFFNTTIVGSATPTFGTRADFTAGPTVWSVAIGDFNLDGKPDIVCANRGATSASYFLNTTTTGSATPSFTAKTDLTIGNTPWGVSVGDLNCDGKPDILSASRGALQFSVFLNNTAPNASTLTLLTRTDNTTASQPYFPVIADYNGDGKPDVAVDCGTGNAISVFINTTDLSTTAPSFSGRTDLNSNTNPYSSAVADINGDGKQDLITPNTSTSTISVFMNTTSPGASTPVFSNAVDFTGTDSPTHIAIGDLNGDGKPDLMTANYTSNTFTILLNTTTPGAATPTFTARTDFSSPNLTTWISTGDINGDGKKDIVTANNGASTVSVFINTTAPGALIPTTGGSTDFAAGDGTYAVSISDVNGDGKPDLITANRTANTVSVLLNTTTPGASTPTFLAKVDFAAGTNPLSTLLTDFNGDGKPDIVTANYLSNNVSVLLNTTTTGAATPTFTAKVDFATGNNSDFAESGDINGDGRPDLAVTNAGSNTVSVFLNSTTPGSSTPSFTSRTNYGTLDIPSSVVFSDFNLDGKQDLGVVNSLTSTISIRLNTAVYALPVELASFTSSVNGNNVLLNWNTVSEENNSGFDIERNSFGTGWNKVGFIAGKGTTNASQNYSFTDNALNSGRYSYRLKQIDYNGNYKYYDLQNEVVIGVPNKFALSQNYPNPFNPTTKINFELPTNGFVALKIFDISGREVAQLVNEVREAGYYSVSFDAKSLSSGTYFYKLTSDNFSDVKKMVVVK